MEVSLIWITPDAEKLLGHIARVSNPANQGNDKVEGLINYMIKHQHWSPFEMVAACVEINTTRDIGRQILRHRSFTFQEFCVAGDTEITLELPNGVASGKRSAYKRTIEHLYKIQEANPKALPSNIRVFDEASKTFVTTNIKEVFKTGVKPLYRLTLHNGKAIECTKEHKFYTSNGFQTLEEAVGLELSASNIASMCNADVAFACNGIPAYQSKEVLYQVKMQSISDKTGLYGVAEKLSANVNTVRKWLKRHGLQFTKLEVASYSDIWNKGKFGYKTDGHSIDTIQKMKASAKRGSESNLWRGGASRSERLKIADWCGSIRTEKLKSVNYKCQRCSSNTLLELHHIKTVSEHPELAYCKDNIEVLCKACHVSHHNLSGDRKVWRERSKGNTLTIEYSKVKHIEYIGEKMTYDLEVNHSSHNYVANGIVTHNSQRYATSDLLSDELDYRECRLQDTVNRQNSVISDDDAINEGWDWMQREVYNTAMNCYHQALSNGIAKEQARALLPEGLTPTRMYIQGTLRSFIHYCQLRTGPETQKEHREIAQAVSMQLAKHVPTIWKATGLL